MQQSWNDLPANKTNLRLFYPGKGWVSYLDRMGEDRKVQARGSAENIDSALINALSATNFSALTGAGTSLYVRNKSPELRAPSMSDLWSEVLKSVGDKEFYSICGKFKNAKLSDNIEKLLSLCKIYLELNEAADTGNQEVSEMRQFVDKAEQCILSKVNFVDGDTELSQHEIFVRKIGRRGFRKARAKIFTTNYDLTFEEAARRLRFVVIDGFSHSPCQSYDRMHFELDIVRREGNRESPDFIPNVFHLYKLHGSADWRRIGTEVVRSRNSLEGTPVLIYPRSSKYQEAFEPPFLDMMGVFQEALRQPDTSLIISGFGFNDDHLSKPIIAALETNLSLRLIVCDPSFIPNCDPAEHIVPHQPNRSNKFLARIEAFASSQDPRIHLINGRFEDLADALPDLIGQTDRERHIERVRITRETD